MSARCVLQACSRSRVCRARRLVVVTLALALATVALQLPGVAAGDVAPAATRTESDKLVAPIRAPGYTFGDAVSADGDSLVVGAPRYSLTGLDRLGIAYEFARGANDWELQSFPMVASDPGENDYFAWSVAVDGDTAVVGANNENNGDGAAYVYRRDGDGVLRFQQKLVAPGRPATAYFGESVDIHDGRIVVGAPTYSSASATNVGIAYVFALEGSTWILEDTLSGSGTVTFDGFGRDVAIDGERIVAGAPFANGFAGAAFVYVRQGSSWSEEQRIDPDGGSALFGAAVDLSGSTALVGAAGPSGPSTEPGDAAVYVRRGDSWTMQQRLESADGIAGDRFGLAVEIDGDTAIVGAHGRDDRGQDSGAAYVFGRSGTTWNQRDKLLASDGGFIHSLGFSVSMTGDTAIVGSPGEDQSRGAAYVFDGILGPYEAVKIAGATRYETAIEASEEAFPDGADTVVIATGENWPDALGGAALAGAHEGPILLTLGSSVQAAVMNEIERLDATNAIILGGPGAVSPAVETALAGKLGTANVRRIGGATRYETAELIARAVESKVGANFEGTCFVATGLNFPDALAGSPLSAAGPWPIFLAPATGMTPSTLATMNDIGVTDVLILGGTGVVSQAIEEGLAADVSGGVIRLAGPTRYETAVEVATYGVEEAHLRWNGVALATGENFPDALAGGPLQGRKGSVMLLSHTTFLTASTGQVLEDEKRDIATVRFLGGTGALSQTVRDQVGQALE